jgi:hypothetical protein
VSGWEVICIFFWLDWRQLRLRGWGLHLQFVKYKKYNTFFYDSGLFVVTISIDLHCLRKKGEGRFVVRFLWAFPIDRYVLWNINELTPYRVFFILWLCNANTDILLEPKFRQGTFCGSTKQTWTILFFNFRIMVAHLMHFRALTTLTTTKMEYDERNDDINYGEPSRNRRYLLCICRQRIFRITQDDRTLIFRIVHRVASCLQPFDAYWHFRGTNESGWTRGRSSAADSSERRSTAESSAAGSSEDDPTAESCCRVFRRSCCRAFEEILSLLRTLLRVFMIKL